MAKKHIKAVAAIIIVVATITVFGYYILRHPQIISQLKTLPLSLVIILLGMYIVFMLCLAWIQKATLELCSIKLGRKESMMLMMYSSIINFFGPLQSGPAFRAAYLKRKHNIKLKQYGVATLLYYGFYALFSGLFVMTAFVGIWALGLILLAVILTPFVLRSTWARRLIPVRFRTLHLDSIGHLATATLTQVCTTGVIFYTELNSLGHSVKVIPAFIYTGAANFALFVSITPGAIGFREAFLTFTRHLHHLNNSQIITANLIDRSVYIVFMAILALLVFGLHTGDFLKKK